MDKLGTSIGSEVVPTLEVEMYGQYIGRGVNSLSIVGRLCTLQSVHYQRFHCILSLSHHLQIRMVRSPHFRLSCFELQLVLVPRVLLLLST